MAYDPTPGKGKCKASKAIPLSSTAVLGRSISDRKNMQKSATSLKEGEDTAESKEHCVFGTVFQPQVSTDRAAAEQPATYGRPWENKLPRGWENSHCSSVGEMMAIKKQLIFTMVSICSGQFLKL